MTWRRAYGGIRRGALGLSIWEETIRWRTSLGSGLWLQGLGLILLACQRCDPAVLPLGRCGAGCCTRNLSLSRWCCCFHAGTFDNLASRKSIPTAGCFRCRAGATFVDVTGEARNCCAPALAIGLPLGRLLLFFRLTRGRYLPC